MTIVESFLLAVALCADTLAVSTASGLKYRTAWRRWLLLAAILGGFQGFFPLMGALLGATCERFIESVDHWIAFTLLLMIGGKMIVDALRSKKSDAGSQMLDAADHDGISPNDDTRAHGLRLGTMCLLGVATSIDAFAVGIGFGLDSSVSEIFVTCGIIAAVTFTVAMCGIALGRAGRNIPERWTGILAGIVLVGIGTKILVEHLGEL